MGRKFIYGNVDQLAENTEGLEALVREVASEAAAQFATFVGSGLAGGSAVGREMGFPECHKDV
jgi:hypothetical protein